MTNLIRASIALLTVLMIAGCAHTGEHKHAKYLRDGVLKQGIHKQAFLDVWGPPDNTKMTETPESISAGWGVYGGRFYSGKRALEIWNYEKYGVELVFSQQELVNYKTLKSTQELKSFAKPKPATE